MRPVVITDPPTRLWEKVIRLAEDVKAADPDLMRMTWLYGVQRGHVAALIDAPEWGDVYEEARERAFTYPWPYEQVRYGLRMLADTPPGTLLDIVFYSGVLYGYNEATYPEYDAVECSYCGNRVLVDRQRYAQCRHHGYLCGQDCLTSLCEPLCDRLDDVTWWEPQAVTAP